MLQIQHLTITHTKDLRELIRDLSLILHPGDKLAIIGEEGTGKSTLLQAIVNPTSLASYATVSGTVTNQFAAVGYLRQSLPDAVAQQTVAAFLYDDLDYNSFDFAAFYRYVAAFGLDIERFEDQEQSLASLSGGEKIKLQLAKLLAHHPDLLLLDEPTSDLDVDTVTWLEDFIQQSDKTIVFISHDERILSHAATAILHLELLQKRQQPRATYYAGHYQQYKEDRQVRFDKQLQVANKEREDYAKRMTENQRIQQRVEHQLRHTKNDAAGRLLAKKMHTLQAQERRFEKEALQFTAIPQDMDAIHLFFSGITPLPMTKRLLNWEQKELDTGQVVDLMVGGQEKITITGPNGIGKTRLLQTIRQELCKRSDLSLGYMPQNYEELLPPQLSALDFLTEKATAEQARTLLASLRFTREEILHTVADLSGGQKAKLFLAKMVLARNNVLILDEPTRHFSPTSQPLIRQMLQDFPGAIISVSHDREFIEGVVQTVYRLDKDSLNTTFHLL